MTPYLAEPADAKILKASYESVAKNLVGRSNTLTYTADVLTSVAYAIVPSGTITKTLTYTAGKLTSITLSGTTPAGITLTKTLTYTGTKLTGISYA